MDVPTQAVWTGWITFGLVSLRVQLFPASRRHGVDLHEVLVADGSRIQHRRVCQAGGREVDNREITKGHKTPDGHSVVLEEADLQALPLPGKHVIDVLGFTPVDGLDPVLVSRAHYAAPHGQAGQRAAQGGLERFDHVQEVGP
ncbi:Ku protein [Streptomyces sp. CoT10]|uniref:Ku protein n=1 Tax=Streptomyces sp. CoT10 TaxID=2875762 RepID=UPI001CD20102|nr:Ku protein [Streptomyces sp. CoT10]